MLFSEGYEVSLGEPNEPELEFWMRIKELEDEVSELESLNKILIETGHWIGQEEAFDLKMAVKKFLDTTRLGRILDKETSIWEVPDWQMRELSAAASNCDPFKSYSLSKGLEKQP